MGNPLCGPHHRSRPSACCGGKKSCPEAEALGRSRGGLSTKIHVGAAGNGKLITFILTPGQQPEATVAEQLLQQGAAKRKSVGRPRLRPRRMEGDKGYSNWRYRRFLRGREIRLTIPHNSNQSRPGGFDRETYRLRIRVERLSIVSGNIGASQRAMRSMQPTTLLWSPSLLSWSGYSSHTRPSHLKSAQVFQTRLYFRQQHRVWRKRAS